MMKARLAGVLGLLLFCGFVASQCSEQFDFKPPPKPEPAKQKTTVEFIKEFEESEPILQVQILRKGNTRMASYRVVGTSTVFDESGTSNGRPLYRAGTTNTYIGYDGGGGWSYYTISGSTYHEYSVMSTSMTPPLTGWEVSTYGEEPPIVLELVGGSSPPTANTKRSFIVS